jgi:hypothetical protein
MGLRETQGLDSSISLVSTWRRKLRPQLDSCGVREEIKEPLEKLESFARGGIITPGEHNIIEEKARIVNKSKALQELQASLLPLEECTRTRSKSWTHWP